MVWCGLIVLVIVSCDAASSRIVSDRLCRAMDDLVCLGGGGGPVMAHLVCLGGGGGPVMAYLVCLGGGGGPPSVTRLYCCLRGGGPVKHKFS